MCTNRRRGRGAWNQRGGERERYTHPRGITDVLVAIFSAWADANLHDNGYDDVGETAKRDKKNRRATRRGIRRRKRRRGDREEERENDARDGVDLLDELVYINVPRFFRRALVYMSPDFLGGF